MDKITKNLSNADGDDLKSSLLEKYRKIFVEKLTPEQLEELQVLLKNKFNPDRTMNREFVLKFEFRLRDFFHEDFLMREMANIEALVENLKPEDLKKNS